ncbi:putative acetyltransferase [Streptococcus intermedius BA1]|nr:putative acetyltransferase [Streptococcus intermedius BA1]
MGNALKCLGKELFEYGIKRYSIHDLAINEQNPLAKDFYS